MYRALISLLFLGFVRTAIAQFYPDSNTSWCLTYDENMQVLDLHFTMGEYPDTVINGTTYKHVVERALVMGNWQFTNHYVRSAIDGKGYVFLVDPWEEYLTGDLSAEVGDTVRNVLVRDRYCEYSEFLLVDLIVDSVVTRSNNGVTVQRHYVRYPCSAWGDLAGERFFWQAGAGTAYGPFLRMTTFDAELVIPGCIYAMGIYVFNLSNGLPGIDCGCDWVHTGIAGGSSAAKCEVSPNPSTGLFHFTGTTLTEIHILDTQGRTLFTTNKPEVDLSAYPVGCYRAVVVSESGKSILPLVVVR
jgi:hypothetical protein